MVSEVSNIIHAARKCRSKRDWAEFSRIHGDAVAQSRDKKLTIEVFKHISSDPDALKYEPTIFVQLLRGARLSDNLDLALEVALFCDKLSNLDLFVEVITIHTENSDPKIARKTANRALRISNLTAKQELKLRMHVVSSYAEEGRYSRASSMFDRVEKLIDSEELSTEDKFDFKRQIARLHFFLGNYDQAIPYYKKTSEYYIREQKWEIASRCLFNAAACLSNSDNSKREEAFFYIETCREICEKHSLPGPLAHIESFYGLNAYQSGNFIEAKEYFYAALQHTQDEEAKFNRLHFLSMLALTCYSSGKFKLGKKYAEQTLSLAESDESDRYRTRYLNLKAEMYWQEGELQKSHELLRPAFQRLISKGLFTLEELATFNLYISQEGELNSKTTSRNKIKVADSLKRNSFNWLETQYRKAEIFLNSDSYTEAELLYKTISKEAKVKENKYHYALSLLGLIKIRLKKNKLDEKLSETMQKFGISVAKIANSPLKADFHIAQASIAYKKGDLTECVRSLRAAKKVPSISWTKSFTVNTWLNTVEGKSTKFPSEFHRSLVTRMTKIFFNPNIEIKKSGVFLIAGTYSVDLTTQPLVHELIKYLASNPNQSFSPEELQTYVWKQPTTLTGWQQKVRNTIHRLRLQFSACMVPIVLTQNGIKLYNDAIAIGSSKTNIQSKESRIIKILGDSSGCSSIDLATKLGVSNATAKRTLKTLVDDGTVFTKKSGRNVFYHLKLR